MGMYDEIKIHDNFLSDKLKGKNTTFQTKSLFCELSELIIDKYGNLKIKTKGNKYKKIIYTGEIRCHGYVDNKWTIVVLWCVEGNIKDKVVFIEHK
jgi:hypothetical protein